MDYISSIPIPKKPYIKKYDIKANKRLCCVVDCNKPHKARGLCNTHYRTILRREKGIGRKGDAFSPSRVTPLYKINIATIDLLGSNGNIVAKAIIDIEDIRKVNEYHWGFKRDAVQGYTKGMSKRKRVYRHRVIMQPKPHLVVDHIKHNTLDNRKSNLLHSTSTPSSSFSIWKRFYEKEHCVTLKNSTRSIDLVSFLSTNCFAFMPPIIEPNFNSIDSPIHLIRNVYQHVPIRVWCFAVQFVE